MSNHRVRNITRGFSLKRKQAVRAVAECACAWVEVGETIRDLSLREAIAARSQQSSTREPMPFAELPGLLYRPPTAEQAHTMRNYGLMQAANRFAAENA
jgi:hypothetical protein